MKTYNVYIGANNRTKQLESAKIKQFMARYFDGFSFQAIQGYWKGKAERTAQVTVACNDVRKVQKMALHAKSYFKQESIMLVKFGTSSFI